MHRPNPIYTENTIIANESTDVEIFKYHKGITDKFINIRGFTFIDKENICILQEHSNHYGLPGGKIEKDEIPDDALKREVKEEINAEVLEYFPIAIIKWHFLKSNTIDYALVYQCEVSLNDGPIEDPDDDIKERLVIKFERLAEYFHNSKQIKALMDCVEPSLDSFLAKL